MQYIKGYESYRDDRGSAVTLGKFDGLHRGHEKLVHEVIKRAKKENLVSIVCSFNMVPFLEAKGVPCEILMTKEEQSFRLKERIDYLIDCPFTEEFSHIEAEDFIRDILIGRFHARYVVVGTDYCFGYQKRGNVQMLRDFQEKYGYELLVFEKERYLDRIISSSYIKDLLSEGEVDLANRLLGYPYMVTGVVEHGKKLGRTLGFPTINVAPERHKKLPPRGVYMARVVIDDKYYNAICNVGVKPTVAKEPRMLVESYLFDYDGDAYGKPVTVELLRFTRPEQKFASVDELKACVDRDIEAGRAFFG